MLLVASLLRLVSAGFIESYPLLRADKLTQVLLPFIVYAAIDVDKKVMKFFINSQVQNQTNLSSTDVLISDVDPQTNRFTTLNVKMDFMGKTLIQENLRLCDYLAVKNTSCFADSPRYNGQISTTTTSVVPTASNIPENQNPFHLVGNKSTSLYKKAVTPNSSRSFNLGNCTGFSYNASSVKSIANSNQSIETFFSNSTGNLTQCPLYQNDSIVLYYEADISATFRKLGSYSFKFTVVSNGNSSDIIGGSVCYVTSTVESESLKRLLFFGMIAICLCIYIVTFLITVLSPDQESSNPFLIEASTICNERLLRQLDADPTKLLNYLQYAVFLSGLNVQYPGFFLSAISQIKWCTLMDIRIVPWTSRSTTERDNVFVTYHSNGLGSLIQSNSDGYVSHCWPNFMICLAIWVAFTVICYQLFICVKVVAKRKSGSFLGSFFGLQSSSGYSMKHSTMKNYSVLTHDTTSNDSISDQNDFVNIPLGPSYNPNSKPMQNNTPSFSYSLSINGWAILGQVLRQCITTFGFPFLIFTLHMFARASSNDSQFSSYKQSFLAFNAFNPMVPYHFLQPWKFLLPSYYPQALTDKLPLLPASPSMRGVVAAGSITIILWFTAVIYFVCYYFLLKALPGYRKCNIHKLYSSVKSIVIWVHFYNVYKPSMLGFVLLDLFSTVLQLFIIVFLQSFGIAQVILLCLIELVKYTLKLFFKPLFLASPWYGLDHFILCARVMLTILCIPYIRELRISEFARSCVAFAQLSIHLAVGLYYILYAVFCFTLTAKAAVRAVKSKRKSLMNDKSTSGEEALDEFEFRQVPAPTSHLTDRSPECLPSSQSSIIETEIDYYRAQSEKHLMDIDDLGRDVDDLVERVLQDESSSIQQAKKRIQKTDYTIREADKIYRKYFLNDEMDPEMRELWESRDWKASPKKAATKDVKHTSVSWLETLKSKFVSTKPQGFEVVNRRPIVVQNARVCGESSEPRPCLQLSCVSSNKSR